MKKRFALRALALLFCCTTLAGCAPAAVNGDPENSASSANTLSVLSVPEYPSFLSYADYDGASERQEELSEDILSSLQTFSAATAAKLLPAEDENALYSPASLYFALSMLAESADGETREQILALLDTRIETLRSGLGAVYRALYIDNEYCRLQAANSLWFPLDENFGVKEEILSVLSNNYYAEIYRTEFGSDTSAKEIADWIAGNTGNKLGGDPSSFMTDAFPDTAMILYNTLYYKDEWIDRFDEEKTEESVFHTAAGEDVSCDFMNRTYGSHGMDYGENYSAMTVSLKEGSMQFILPDEGTTPYDLLGDTELMQRILTGTDTVESIYGEVVFSVPKFDYSDRLNLTDALAELGVTNAFDPENADFSPVSDWKPLYLSSALQETSIAIDENGVEAAAFTELAFVGAGMPTGRGEMILDRPFLCVIYSQRHLPLFIGVVNNPAV